MPAETAARGSYAKTAARREQILDAAFEVFSLHGYRKGSLRDIAELAGVSHGVVLFHFKTKENLLVAVLEMRDERSRHHFSADAEPGIGGLREFLALIRDNVNDAGLVELYSVLAAEATAPTHPVHEYFRARYLWITEVVRGSLVALASKGQLQPGVDPDHSARTLVAVVEGLQLQWLYNRDEVDMVADLHRFMQSLLAVPLLPPGE
jgi:AcrR family transcriptional regulator